jgi:copper homeostasis protein (lipoprotein)
MRTHVVLALLLPIALAACGSSEPESMREAATESAARPRKSELPPPTPRNPAAALDASYSGTLPCADCTGIDATYRFTASPGEPGGAYHATWIYQGKPEGDATVEKDGTWTEVRGQGGHPDAIVYQTDPEKAYDSSYFLVASDDRIEMLDRDRKRIRSRLNYTLMRVTGTP